MLAQHVHISLLISIESPITRKSGTSTMGKRLCKQTPVGAVGAQSMSGEVKGQVGTEIKCVVRLDRLRSGSCCIGRWLTDQEKQLKKGEKK
jgi:hypothetical protein